MTIRRANRDMKEDEEDEEGEDDDEEEEEEQARTRGHRQTFCVCVSV